jgi:hypothetical protein
MEVQVPVGVSAPSLKRTTGRARAFPAGCGWPASLFYVLQADNHP